MNANRVIPRLYQGSKPLPGCIHGIDVLVLMAHEYQPKGRQFPCNHVIHAPIDDGNTVTPQERWTIDHTAKLVAAHLQLGRRILVTCNMGLNRSGVVTALAICKAYPQISAKDAIRLVRQARGLFALSNPRFIEIVEGTNDHR